MFVDIFMAMIFHSRGFIDNEKLDIFHNYFSKVWWLFKVSWFLVGNVWIYSDKTCWESNIYIENPNLWNFSLAVLILNYFGIVFLIFLILLYSYCKRH